MFFASFSLDVDLVEPPRGCAEQRGIVISESATSLIPAEIAKSFRVLNRSTFLITRPYSPMLPPANASAEPASFATKTDPRHYFRTPFFHGPSPFPRDRALSQAMQPVSRVCTCGGARLSRGTSYRSVVETRKQFFPLERNTPTWRVSPLRFNLNH